MLGVCVSIACFGAGAESARPAPLAPVPTAKQLAWQRMETNLFVHFTVNAFTNREWGEGTEDPKIFNPSKLDARQWVRAAKAGGFKMVILTAKHHDGFCLWPSQYTEHSVKSSPWKNGQGDIVREVSEACKEEGLKLGLYLSPWDRHEKSYGDSPKYNDYYINQLTELLSNYGPITEVWFDGACGEGPNGKKQEYDFPRYYATVYRLQPEAVIFGGPDIRWIGNESGVSGDPCWAPYDPKTTEKWETALPHGHANGTEWKPGESDVSIRPGWFWHAAEDAKVRSVDNLVDLYFKSVGRNSLLLLNVPPNTDGLFCATDVERLKGFRERLDSLFRDDLARGKEARASSTRGNDARFAAGAALDGDPDTYWATDDGVNSGWIEVNLGEKRTFNVACLQEAISLGQRVEAYRLEYWKGGKWRALCEGTTIGHKKLERFKPVTSKKVRLVIDKARACPTIAGFGLYNGDSGL